MLLVPNDNYIAISKLIKDDILIKANVVKYIGTIEGQQ